MLHATPLYATRFAVAVPDVPALADQTQARKARRPLSDTQLGETTLVLPQRPDQPQPAAAARLSSTNRRLRGRESSREEQTVPFGCANVGLNEAMARRLLLGALELAAAFRVGEFG